MTNPTSLSQLNSNRKIGLENPENTEKREEEKVVPMVSHIQEFGIQVEKGASLPTSSNITTQSINNDNTKDVRFINNPQNIENREDASQRELLLTTTRLSNTIGFTQKAVELFEKIFEPDQSPSQDSLKAAETILFGNKDAEPLINKTKDYVSRDLQAPPEMTNAEYKTIVESGVGIAMHKRPEYFQPNDNTSKMEEDTRNSNQNSSSTLEPSEERNFKIMHRFFQEATSKFLLPKIEEAQEKEKTSATQNPAMSSLLDGFKSAIEWFSSDNVWDPKFSPLNQDVDPKDWDRLETLEKWLSQNPTHPERERYKRETKALQKKIGELRQTRIRSIGDWAFSTITQANPEFSDIQSPDEIEERIVEKAEREQREKFEKYFKEIFPKPDFFELNDLRKFWENLYRSQDGKIFYEIVCEALSSESTSSDFHKAVLNVWFLSLIDTIHEKPQEARSRMPGLSYAGIQASNFGYDMPKSQSYLEWASNPMARACGDIIIDAFHWLIDLGDSFDTDAFLEEMRKIFRQEYSEKIPYNYLIHTFNQFLLERVFKIKYKEGINIENVLIQAYQKENPNSKDLMGDFLRDIAKPLLEKFRSFAQSRKTLRPNANPSDPNGFVFGIGFNGRLFDSPCRNPHKDVNEIWLSFSDSGREIGGYLFLTWLIEVSASFSKQLAAPLSSSRKIEELYSIYKALILEHIRKINNNNSKYNFEDLTRESDIQFAKNEQSKFIKFEQEISREHSFAQLSLELQTWISRVSNWYKLPCKIQIAEEMPKAEEKAHESARELLFHAVMSRSFAKDYPQLMPLLFRHWKDELISLILERKNSELLEKVKLADSLVKLSTEEKEQVEQLLDELVGRIHPALMPMWNTIMLKEISNPNNFIQSKLNEVRKNIQKVKETIRNKEEDLKIPDNNHKRFEGKKSSLEKTKAELRKLEQEENNYIDATKIPPSKWNKQQFQELKSWFFKNRNIGQCIEPVFARVLGHDHFFPVFISQKVGKTEIPDPNNANHQGLKLGTQYPQDVIPPCDKKCQIHALAHLYTGDLLGYQSAEQLNTIRRTHNQGEVPEKVYSVDEFRELYKKRNE